MVVGRVAVVSVGRKQVLSRARIQWCWCDGSVPAPSAATAPLVHVSVSLRTLLIWRCSVSVLTAWEAYSRKERTHSGGGYGRFHQARVQSSASSLPAVQNPNVHLSHSAPRRWLWGLVLRMSRVLRHLYRDYGQIRWCLRPIELFAVRLSGDRHHDPFNMSAARAPEGLEVDVWKAELNSGQDQPRTANRARPALQSNRQRCEFPRLFCTHGCPHP